MVGHQPFYGFTLLCLAVEFLVFLFVDVMLRIFLLYRLRYMFTRYIYRRALLSLRTTLVNTHCNLKKNVFVFFTEQNETFLSI